MWDVKEPSHFSRSVGHEVCGVFNWNESSFPIAHFHKWGPLLHSFVFMLVRPIALVLKQIFF